MDFTGRGKAASLEGKSENDSGAPKTNYIHVKCELM